jgi:phosphate-selective porin OprO/OprP
LQCQYKALIGSIIVSEDVFMRTRIVVLLLASISAPVLAVDLTTEILARKGIISADEYEKIRQAQSTQATVDTADGLKFITADKSFAAQIGTLLQMDMAGYNSDIKDSTGSDISNAGSEFRRIRLYMTGTFLANWDYKTEIEFANTTQLMDGYVAYRGLPGLQFTMGHFKIPFSQESLMADKGLTFMERSLPNAFLNARAPGAMVSAGRDNWSAAFMLFGEQLSSAAAANSDEGGGISLRGTWAPLIGPGANLHFGAAASTRIPSQGNTPLTTTPITYADGVRFRSKPESNIIETRLVDTGATGIINVDRTDLLGMEIGGSWQAINLNAEYINTVVRREKTLDDLHFSGWYVQAGWVITGEERLYKGDKGLFDGIKPGSPVDQGGSGAWELALRLSEIDLRDGDSVLVGSRQVPEVDGGKQRDATLAVNWYLNQYVRMGTNYIHVLDVEGGKYNKASLNALQLRMQLAY